MADGDNDYGVGSELQFPHDKHDVIMQNDTQWALLYKQQ